MAMWYQPRQLASGPNAGKWHYTAGSDEGGGTFPVGACGKNCPGHDTAEGAREHYVAGICAGEIRERDDTDQQLKCFECGEWTQHRAILWEDDFHRDVPVCASHDVRAVLTKERRARE